MGTFLSWLTLAFIILYLVSPIDLVPDFLGLPARIDDLLVALIGAYSMFRRRRVRKGQDETSGSGRAGPERESRRGGGAEGRPGTDPYEVLGVAREAALDEIEQAYRDLLKKYHPDKVEHLGDEFRAMAEERTKTINEAYSRLLRERKG